MIVIIGPEQPLIDGLADLLRNANIKVFGPGQDAAQIEGSKLFAKQLMDKYRIPTAEYKEVSSRNEALQYVETCDLPIVIKKDGLAAGKGVIIAFTREDALEGSKKFIKKKKESRFRKLFRRRRVFNDFVNGDYAVPFDCIAQDHKRAFDNDQGPNTGGMGAYCPVPHIDASVLEQTNKRLLNLLLKLWHKKVMTSSITIYIVQF